jgi:hypothetical protein
MSAFRGKADMTVAHVRFRGRYWEYSGHALLHCICLLVTQSGHTESSPSLFPMSICIGTLFVSCGGAGWLQTSNGS